MPADYVARHIDRMFAVGPFAETITFGTQATRGTWKDDAVVLEDETGRDVVRRTRVATIRTGTLTGVAIGSTVRVAGVAYEVRRVLPMEDGQLTRLIVARADA